MKTFLFIEKNGSGVLTLSADNYEEADKTLGEKVKFPLEWRCEDEEGEDDGVSD